MVYLGDDARRNQQGNGDLRQRRGNSTGRNDQIPAMACWGHLGDSTKSTLDFWGSKEAQVFILQLLSVLTVILAPLTLPCLQTEHQKQSLKTKKTNLS